MMRASVLSMGLALLLAGCSSSGGTQAPLIAPPAKIESFCTGSNMAPRATALAAIMTSTDDKILATHPNEAGIVRELRVTTGAIGHWNHQLLALPKSAKALGETDGYARVDALAIPAAMPNATNRVVYFQVRDHGAARWVALTAYDVQNVCIAGRPQV